MDLDAEMRAMIDARATDMPFGPAKQPISLANTARAYLPKTAVWCAASAQQMRQMVDSGNTMFKELAGAGVDVPGAAHQTSTGVF